jgi:hypothetical protein
MSILENINAITLPRRSPRNERLPIRRSNTLHTDIPTSHLSTNIPEKLICILCNNCISSLTLEHHCNIRPYIGEFSIKLHN